MASWGELDWWEGHAAVEPLAWGRNNYTVIRLDPVVVVAAATAGTRRLGGWIDEVHVNLGINRTDVMADAFLYCGPALLRRLDVRVGDGVHLRVRPVDPDLVVVSGDIEEALSDAGAWDAFNARRPAERRRLLQPIEDAARPATRVSRIHALLRALA